MRHRSVVAGRISHSEQQIWAEDEFNIKDSLPIPCCWPYACSIFGREMADIDAVSVTIISGTESFPATANLRPLLTEFTYASSCVSHWYQPYPDSPSSYTTLYSTYGRRNYFASCQPSDGSSSLQLRYSPGVCPSGQTIATITESRTVPVAEDGSGRVWLAYCCLRYVR